MTDFCTFSHSPSPSQNIICLYDSSALSTQNASPLMAWSGFGELAVSFSLHPSNPNVFFSGSQDKSIRFCESNLELM